MNGGIPQNTEYNKSKGKIPYVFATNLLLQL